MVRTAVILVLVLGEYLSESLGNEDANKNEDAPLPPNRRMDETVVSSPGNQQESRLCCGGLFCLSDSLVRTPAECLCDENEEYDSCGTACPKRCGEPPAEVCIMVCVKGCACKEGYCLDENEVCLPDNPGMDDSFFNQTTALETCEENAYYDQCGTTCPKRCGEPPADFCPAMCVEGCQCRKGFCLEEDGTCSPDSDQIYNLVGRTFSLLCPFGLSESEPN